MTSRDARGCFARTDDDTPAFTATAAGDVTYVEALLASRPPSVEQVLADNPRDES